MCRLWAVWCVTNAARSSFGASLTPPKLGSVIGADPGVPAAAVETALFINYFSIDGYSFMFL